MIGIVLLIALWMAEPDAAPGAVPARRAISITELLIALLALLVLAATLALQWTVERAPVLQFLTSAIAAAAVVAMAARQYLSRATPMHVAVTRLAVAWCLLFSLAVLGLIAAMNRTQDIDGLAMRVAQAAGPGPLLLWNPDETTLAWAQLSLPAERWTALDAADAGSPAQLEQRFHSAPGTTIVSLIMGRGWAGEQWLAYLQGRATATEQGTPVQSAEPALAAAGLVTIAQVERPGGRGYLLSR